MEWLKPVQILFKNFMMQRQVYPASSGAPKALKQAGNEMNAITCLLALLSAWCFWKRLCQVVIILTISMAGIIRTQIVSFINSFGITVDNGGIIYAGASFCKHRARTLDITSTFNEFVLPWLYLSAGHRKGCHIFIIYSKAVQNNSPVL